MAGRTSSRPVQVGVPQGELYRGGRIGKYEILTQLSVGGMAELFLAFTSGPGGFRKFVVVKRILPDARSDEQFVKMFFDEARITATLNHPNIAQVFDLGEDGDSPYLAMEFIAGQNLNQVMKACLKQKHGVPLGVSVAVAHDVCLALHHAHSHTDGAGRPRPVIHRDVAQKNVMLTYDGAVKLLDFGIAKAQGSLGRTQHGMVKGTTGYMSPEQVRGEPLDGRSDVFAVGVMLHELLTGRRLFSASTEAEEMERILSSPIPRPTQLAPEVPGAIADVVMNALARDRGQRIASARQLAKALETAAGRRRHDPEQLAGFMRGLFDAKITATRTLLESAGEEDPTVVRSVASVLSDDVGMVFPERDLPEVDPEERTAKSARAATESGESESESESVETDAIEVPSVIVTDPGLRTAEEEALATEFVAAVETTQSTRPARIWVMGVLGVVVTLAIGGYFLFEQLLPAPAPVVEEELSEFGSGRGLKRTGPVAIPRAPGAKAIQGLPPGISAPGEQLGTLSLSTDRPCTVQGGGRVFGKTPLDRVELPEGPHTLILKGDDGVNRRLLIHVEAGKNRSLTTKLSELPEVP